MTNGASFYKGSFIKHVRTEREGVTADAYTLRTSGGGGGDICGVCVLFIDIHQTYLYIFFKYDEIYSSLI